jgi:hypothetical protein
VEEKKQLKTTIRKAGQLAHSSKPKVKKVTPYEVYLIDSKGRESKRICGTQRNSMPEGYYCVNASGEGTDHPGWGQCQYHDRQLSNGQNTGLWLTLNRQAGLPANLLEYYQNAEVISEEHLSSVDDDIKALYALQTYILSRRRDENNDGYITNQDIDLVMKLTDKIFKAKELRVKLNKEVSLDTTTVKAFVDQIFKIIMANAAKNVGKRILTEILDEVIVPFKTQGRIVGAEFDYTPTAAAEVDKVIVDE